ncbi:MAG: tetratricopeptide repeat protein, partial [Deltaproteobacteria bacterium]|nr:tetratricopeptide repeat protein [Deltaproteobacteria bacterium]
VVVMIAALTAIPVFAASLVIDPVSQFRFADGLMDRGEYDRAILEYERFIHFFPEEKAVSSARLLMGLCFMKAGRYEKARTVFQEIITNHHDDVSVQKALFLMGESYYQQGISREAEYYFQRLFREFPQSKFRQAVLYRLGWTKMREDQWEEASCLFGKIKGTSPYYGSANELAAASLKGKTLPRKSPKLAGTLAAVLPGLGHAYVGRYKDGSVAFLVNALFIWAAVESFHNDNNVLGGMLCFLELGWYSGNIYSAVNVAHKYNRKIRRDFRNGLKDTLELKPLLLSQGGAGLAISFRF